MRFGVIGTNFVTDWFLEAAPQCEGFLLSAVYSRSIQRAEEYAAKYGAAYVFNSLHDLAAYTEVDAVYIASPNRLHFSQTMQLLNAKKHVLCEKPIATNSAQLHAMLNAARENNVILMEAMRPLHTPSLEIIRGLLARIGPVRRAAFSFCQYSSRYDNFNKGIIENAFRPELSNGALMDIGVYCVNMLVALFGLPHALSSYAVKLHNGVDGHGCIIGNYENMIAELTYSKITDGYTPSVIQGELGSIILPHITTAEGVTLQLRGGDKEYIPFNQHTNNMVYEMENFLSFVVEPQKLAPYNQYTTQAMRIMDEVRKQQNIQYPDDV